MKLKAKAYLRIAAEEWRDKYDEVGHFYEGLAQVMFKRKYGLVNKQGTEVVPPKYDFVDDFHKGLARVRLYDKWGYIDKKGTEVVPVKYDYAEKFRDGLSEVELDDKVGWVTREGKELLLTKDKGTQIINLIELEIITKKELINWVKEQIVK